MCLKKRVKIILDNWELHLCFGMFVALFLLTQTADAYTNDTMTPAYNDMVYGDPINAFFSTYEAVYGQWFYFIIAMGPFTGLYLAQRNLHLPTIWLTCVLVGYGSLLEAVPMVQFYLIAVAWVGSIFLRLTAPKYSY